jgi:hypothetical protein
VAAGGTGGSSGTGGVGGGENSAPISCGDKRLPERGLRLHLNSAHGVELEGEGVAAWRNLVAEGPDAVQGDSERRPRVVPSAINGAPAIRLDGENDFLSFELPVGGKTALTLAAVARTWEYQRASPNADCGDAIGRELNCSGTDQSLLCWNEEGNTFSEQGVFFGVGQHEATFRFGTGDAYQYYKTPFVLEHPNDDRFVVSLALLDGDDRTLFLNGEVPRGRVNYDTDELVELRARANGGSVRAESTGWIGKGRFNPASSFWAGEIAELFVYEASLDETERQALTDYLRCVYFPDGF